METKATLNEQGHEILDNTPLALPMGYKTPETLAEQVHRLVRHEQFAQAIGGDEAETFEEADDFDVGDDFDPSSPYEQYFDPILNRDVSAAEWHINSEHYKATYEAQAKAAIPEPKTKKKPEKEKEPPLPLDDDQT